MCFVKQSMNSGGKKANPSSSVVFVGWRSPCDVCPSIMRVCLSEGQMDRTMTLFCVLLVFESKVSFLRCFD